MIRQHTSRLALIDTIHHEDARRTRRRVRQFFRAITPRIDVKGVLRIENGQSRIAETVNRTDAHRRSEHRHG